MTVDRPPPDIENLLAEGRALRALARSLVVRDDVEDVVHDGLLAALARPVAPRRLGAWLSGTVRRLALLRRRAAARRLARDAAVARPVASDEMDPAAIAAQAELVHDTAAAVRALEEPFRTVVLLRFWRGLDVDGIAERLGVPRNTVRSRLVRGLARLRERLDARHGGRARWSVPLLAFTRPDPIGMPPVGAAGSTFVLAMLMKTKLLTGAAALLALAVGVPFLLRDDVAAGGVVATPAQEIAAAPLAMPTEQPAGRREPASPAPAAEAAGAPPAALPFDPAPARVEPWLARFAVVDEADRPVEDATVTIWAARRIEPDATMRRLTGGEGNVYSGRIGEPLFELHTDANGHASVRIELECISLEGGKEALRTGAELLFHAKGRAQEHRIVLAGTIPWEGIALRADGSPAAGARVIARGNGGTSWQGVRAPDPEPVLAGADGRFVLAVHRHTNYSVIAQLDGASSFREQRLLLSATPERLVLVFPGATTLAGTVVDPDGEPVAHARVKAWRECALDDLRHPDDYEHASATSDEHGRFSIAVRRMARYQLLAAAEPHASSELVWVETTPARPHVEVRLPLQRFATIGGVVVRPDGSPLAGMVVFARLDGEQPSQLAVPGASDRFPAVEPTTTGTDGAFELKVHPATAWTVLVQPGQHLRLLQYALRDVAPGRRDLRVQLGEDQIAGCALHVRLSVPGGQPLRDLEVRVVALDDDDRPTRTRRCRPTIVDAGFELGPLPLDERFRIEVLPRGPGNAKSYRDAPFPGVRSAPFVTRREGVVLDVPLAAWGELPVRVLHADGSPARRVRVAAMPVDPLDYGPPPMPVDVDGAIQVRQCAPGSNRLLVSDVDGLLHEQEITILPGPNPPLEIRLRDAGGERR